MTERQDRVAELEGKVRELEATVLGLTEELVESNDRIRRLESRLADDEADARQTDLGQVVASGSTGQHVSNGQERAETGEDGQEPAVTGEESGTAPVEDADPAGEESAEAQKHIAGQSDDQTDTRESDDDIIIA